MMEHPGFFERAGPFPLRLVAETAGATLSGNVDPDLVVSDVRPLVDAEAGHVSFLDNRKYLSQVSATLAAACLI